MHEVVFTYKANCKSSYMLFFGGVLSASFIHLLFRQTLLSFKQANRKSGESAADSHFSLCWTEHIVSTSAVTSQLADLPTPHSDVCMGPNQAPPPQQHNFNFTFLSAANRSESPSFQTFISMLFDSASTFSPARQLLLHLAYFTGAVDSFVSFETAQLLHRPGTTVTLQTNSINLFTFYLLGEKKETEKGQFPFWYCVTTRTCILSLIFESGA